MTREYKGHDIIFNTQYSHVILTSHFVHCCTCVYILYLLRYIICNIFNLFIYQYQFMLCVLFVLCVKSCGNTSISPLGINKVFLILIYIFISGFFEEL